MFSEKETEYLKSQRLARVATASKQGRPEVSPVSFAFDGTYFWIGSYSQEIFLRTRRFRNIAGGNQAVSLVIDDLETIDPWKPRGIKVRGKAEVMDHDGQFGQGKYIRIKPKTSVSWGLEPVLANQRGSPSVKHCQ